MCVGRLQRWVLCCRVPVSCGPSTLCVSFPYSVVFGSILSAWVQDDHHTVTNTSHSAVPEPRTPFSLHTTSHFAFTCQGQRNLSVIFLSINKSDNSSFPMAHCAPATKPESRPLVPHGRRRQSTPELFFRASHTWTEVISVTTLRDTKYNFKIDKIYKYFKIPLVLSPHFHTLISLPFFACFLPTCVSLSETVSYRQRVI